MKKIVSIMLLLSFVACKQAPEISIKKVISPSDVGSMQPYLFADGNELLMSWTQKRNDSVHALYFSRLSESNWSEPKMIIEGANWFVNWADFPGIAKNKNNIITHFLEKSAASTYAYDVHVVQSTDNGASWNNDYVLHKDSTQTEHGFVSFASYKNGFFSTWLDGRNTGGAGHGDSHQSTGAMTIRGATISKQGLITNDTPVDLKTCDCCQTSTAITENGPVIVYRDRSDDEIRDIHISRYVSGVWTKSKAVFDDSWKINGCPVNGPKATSFKNVLAVAWFTAANGNPKVKLAFSVNNGETFDVPIQIDGGKAIGRVDVVLIDKENALISWMESNEENAEIQLLKVGIDGSKSKLITVAEISAARASGFPQMEVIDQTVFLAWNHLKDSTSSIQIKSVDLGLFN